LNPLTFLPADYHTHTPLCKHAVGEPWEYAIRAKELGLQEMGFSDHSPMPVLYDDWRMLMEEFPLYLEKVAHAQAHVPEVTIRLGLEVDWLDGGQDWVETLIGMADWDYLIGSVHYLGDWAMDDPAEKHRFKSQPVEVIWDRYWEQFGKAARSGYFDIMGHPDLVKKFGHRPPGDLLRYYEPAIAAVVDAGVAIEINTAGLFKEVAEMYPAPSFLQLAARAGVPLVISSDAHAPQDVGRSFPTAVQAAREAGFTSLCRFEKRRRRTVDLP
jgi:histidinol-phosphatase (PHP family)